MNQLAKFEIIELPTIYIAGKEISYSDEALNNGDNRLPHFWDECYKNRIFAPLESQTAYVFNNAHAGVFLDWYLGDGNFSYIIGLLMKEGFAVPNGHIVRKLEKTEAALCWVKTKSLTENRAISFESIDRAIKENGRSCNNMKWCINLYHPVRSAIPDENDDVILDCYIPLN